MTSKAEIISSATAAIFGKPLVTNIYRSVVVEAMVAAALSDWEWCSSDYSSHDFRRGKLRLEVKQSALLQTWSSARLSRPSWDIAPRTGYWEGGTVWVPSPGRNADLYLLGLHAVTDENADHRDPLQWRFYVIPAVALPSTKRIGLHGVEKLALSVSHDQLAERVETAAAAIELIDEARPQLIE